MKKVTFLVGRYSHKGGLEKVARHLTKAFADKGCQVTVLTCENDDPPSHPHIEVLTVAKRSKIALSQLIQFDHLCQNWLKEHPQELVFGLERTRKQDLYRAGSGVHKVYLERRKRIDPLFTRLSLALNPLHHTLLHYEKSALEDHSLRLLFTNSSMVKDEILTHFSTDPQKIHVVHNGVEFDQFEIPFHNSSPSNHLYQFLFIGNGYTRKGLPLLLSALAQLQNKEWELTVVGKEKNLPYFQAMTERLSLQKKVHFYGAQKEITPFYQKADSLIIPSLYDPFANVTLEALAMGLFVVSSPFNGGSEILSSDSGKRIENLFDQDCFVAALQQALTAPRDQKSRQSRREYVKKFDYSHQLDLIVQRSLDVI